MTLFNSDLYPITSALAFIKEKPETIVNELISWQTPLIEKYKNSLNFDYIKKDFSNTLLSLCPLTTIEKRRYLVIPTKSEWTAFFDNGHTGTDRTAPTVLGSKLNTSVIYVSTNKSLEENTFEYYDIEGNKYDMIRAVAVIKESKWEFHQYGEAFNFEDREALKSKVIKNRFTNEMLSKYLNHFGIEVNSENFYNTLNSILINKVGPKFEHTKELNLSQAQNFFNN